MLSSHIKYSFKKSKRCWAFKFETKKKKSNQLIYSASYIKFRIELSIIHSGFGLKKSMP